MSASERSPTVLITGASGGIGYEFVRQYAAQGWRVYATVLHAEEAALLRGIEGDVGILRLDLREDDNIAALADALRPQPIDVLLHSAAIYGPHDAYFGNVDYAAWDQVLRINVVAAVKLISAMVDHVARSDKRVIAAMGSGLGSILGNTHGGKYIYRTAKAALNSVMRNAALDLAPRGVSTVVLHPGWVKTEMGGPLAELEVERSVAGMRALLEDIGPQRSGRFYRFDGVELPW
jgi:NAD(P)-dependent dehydrogenase (short-subunit alcohol dehydrogenase family)